MQDLDNQHKKRVLFVCLGNICRSPAAEGIFKHLVEEQGLEHRIEIDSAGTSGYHDGELPDKRMRHHGAQRGYKFDSLSRKFTIEDYNDFDIILAMDDSNYHNVLKLAPDLESRDKVYRMIAFQQELQHDHVPDPYYGGSDGFDLVMDILEDACDGLLKQIKKGEI